MEIMPLVTFPQIDSKSSQKFKNLVQKLILCYTGQNPHTQIFLSASNISLVSISTTDNR